MKYRTTQDVILPIRVSPMVQEFGNRIDITIIIKSEFSEEHDASNVAIIIPTPPTAATVNVTARHGRAKCGSVVLRCVASYVVKRHAYLLSGTRADRTRSYGSSSGLRVVARPSAPSKSNCSIRATRRNGSAHPSASALRFFFFGFCYKELMLASVQPQVPFACSGLQVKYLRILEAKLGYFCVPFFFGSVPL
jgi:AP-2 complex subunit mu-1